MFLKKLKMFWRVDGYVHTALLVRRQRQFASAFFKELKKKERLIILLSSLIYSPKSNLIAEFDEMPWEIVK